jgi:hypothetical protein
MRRIRHILLRPAALAAALVLGVALDANPAHAAGPYHVDPETGIDQPHNGSQAAPWKTINYAAERIARLPATEQAGVVLNLRAGVLHPGGALPATLHGTAEQPILIQPYGGAQAVIDGGEEQLRQPGAWERVPDQPDEWRTRATFVRENAEENSVWGQMTDSKYRLITYFSIEDMRAQNESFHRLPLSDPRPSFGPLVGDETHKMPFTYLGPGLHFRFENAEKTLARIHLRLSPTHLGAAGIEDYPGGGDPNAMNLSIARQFRVALNVDAQNVKIRNVTFQNGGLTTLRFELHARNITLDHCQVHGGRYGVRVGPTARGIRFHDCTFDGGLAPWTSRSDVKNAYFYHGTPDCPKSNGKCINQVGAKTSDILVIHQASDSEFINCTFRRGHDGLQLAGHQVEVRDSLFEDLDDEVIQLQHGADQVRIHGNVIRQALNAVSFSIRPLGGPVYFYRNVVDQRVPTRGHRRLPPDVPEPFVWRYGADFKDQPTLPFHAYQNTFLVANGNDKGSFVSHLFYGDPLVGPTFRNNIYLALDVNQALSRVPGAPAGAISEGNIWYRFHPHPEAFFRMPLFRRGNRAYFTMEQMWADFPDWERNSRYADPLLRGFTDESFDLAGPYPDSDFRPAPGSPAIGGGVVLPPDLPDDFPTAGPPDVGARPADAPAMAVGVGGLTSFPAAGTPVALAGPDQSVTDAAGDGFESVMLDASASHDPDGGLVEYAWLRAGRVIARSSDPRTAVELPEGSHHLQLVVTDSSGQVDTDDVRIAVMPLAAGTNRLACPGFEETGCPWDLRGALGAAVVAGNTHSGARALQMQSRGDAQQVLQRVAVGPGTYLASGWLRTDGLVGATAGLHVQRLNAAGQVLDSTVVTETVGTGGYSYHAIAIPVTEGTAALALVASLQGTAGGRAFFDDLQIRDRNLLENGGFERPPASGDEREVPGWILARGGAAVAEPVFGGGRALVLAPQHDGGGYNAVYQTFIHQPGRGYRISAWLRTVGLEQAPTFRVRFYGGRGENLGTRPVSSELSEGAYRLVSRQVPAAEIPGNAYAVSVELYLPAVPAGAALFDDVVAELLP